MIYIKRINTFCWKKTKTKVKIQFCAQVLHFYPFRWGNFFRFFFKTKTKIFGREKYNFGKKNPLLKYM